MEKINKIISVEISTYKRQKDEKDRRKTKIENEFLNYTLTNEEDVKELVIFLRAFLKK